MNRTIAIGLQSQNGRFFAAIGIVLNQNRRHDAGNHFLRRNTIIREFAEAVPGDDIVAR